MNNTMFIPAIVAVIALTIIVIYVFFILGIKIARFKPSIPPGIMRHKDLEYIRYNGKPLHLDLYVPKGKGPFPVIIWLHSGAWKTLNKSCVEQGVIDQVKREYAVASIDYSLSRQEKWPAQLVQAKTAIRWLRAHAEEYGLNPNKVIAWGMSSGGHLAYLLGTMRNVDRFGDKDMDYQEYSDNVQAVIAWSAPVDLSLLEGSSYQSAAALLGNETNIDHDHAISANPITYIDANDPPIYIMHGTKDRAVPILQSKMILEALQRSGVETHFIELNGYKHADKRFNLQKHLEKIEVFIDSIPE